MPISPSSPSPVRKPEVWTTCFVLVAAILFHLWAIREGWANKNLPGEEFRQAQTALSAQFIQRDHDFAFAYPTPVLGKPWSIPMEFPLYQWTVVVVSDATGLELTSAGRLVSVACFYLALPAIYLLLGRLRVPPCRRWPVFAVLLTCPLYIFYARGFLIETMALMFSLWFWVGFEEAVERRSFGWLLLANAVGAGAGLVKVTTFMLYLIPAGLWAVRRLWQCRRHGKWWADLAWMVGSSAVPFVLTLWWLRFADEIKAANPMGRFLTSDRMMDFNLGTWATRLSPEMWAMKGRFVAETATWWPVLALGAVVAFSAARHRLRQIGLGTAVFVAALVLFPELYARHGYYYVASTAMLLLALGLALVGLAESKAPRWLVALVLLAITGGQAGWYLHRFHAEQSAAYNGGNLLTLLLRELTLPDEVVVVTGHDWNSMFPHFAQRRALMIRTGEVRDTPDLRAALANLRSETIGALALGDNPDHSFSLNFTLVAHGLDPRPLCRWHGTTLYVRGERRAESVRLLRERRYPEIEWEPTSEPPPERLAGEWFEIAALPADRREIFSTMQPMPVRFMATYGPGLDRSGQPALFGAHPVTRLVFNLPAGAHRLRTSAIIKPAIAYDPDLHPDRTTDGVEVSLLERHSGGTPNTLFTRLIDPRGNPADRGPQPLDIGFTLAKPGEVELFVGPGPIGRDTCDWMYFAPISIDRAD